MWCKIKFCLFFSKYTLNIFPCVFYQLLLKLEYHCILLKLPISSICFIAHISIVRFILNFQAYLWMCTSVLKWAYIREICRSPCLENKKLEKYEKHNSPNVSEPWILTNLLLFDLIEIWLVWCVVMKNCNVVLVGVFFDECILSFPICSDWFWLEDYFVAY